MSQYRPFDVPKTQLRLLAQARSLRLRLMLSTTPVTQLTIFLVRPGLTDPDKILEDRDGLEHFDIRTSKGFLGSLYVRKSVERRPRWLAFFAGALDPRKVPAKSASSAAVLLIQRKKQVYALTFGYGRTLLAPGVVDQRFGLRATLNAIDPDRIRSIDRKTFEAISRHTREQVSRESGIGTFGLDVERDLLRAVTGTAADETLGKRFTGMDALTVTVPVTLDGLSEFLERLGGLSEKQDYRERFPWVDRLAEVRDKELARQLDRLIASRIKQLQIDRIWLVPPDIVDWSDVNEFTYRAAKSAKRYDDVSLEFYLEDGCSPADVTPSELRTGRVNCFSAAGDTIVHRWSVWSCLSAEVDFRGAVYVLSDGTWFRVDAGFAAEVDSVIASLPKTKVSLPPYDDDTEAAYNKRIADQEEDLALMDGQLIPAGLGRDKVEFCDLYDRERVLVHVKRNGRSSVLSHLFSQGLVSAQLLFSDPAFRQAVNERLPLSHRFADPATRINPSDFEVAYAIVDRAGRQVRLPFFSRVNLRSVCATLKGFGYNVTLTLAS